MNSGAVCAIAMLTACMLTPAWAEGANHAAKHSEQRPLAGLLNTGFGSGELGVIINDADPVSVRIGNYYQAKRGIPDENMIHVRFDPGATVMSPGEFTRIKAVVDANTPDQVQAYALTWTVPYRVGCMSITTAFAAGFSKQFCADGCAPTSMNPYYNSTSSAPFRDFKLRPTMSLAGRDWQEVKQLIDRGVASDNTHPEGTGYLVDTGDKIRNVRAMRFDNVIQYLQETVNLVHVKADYIKERPDVLFYFTGLEHVPKLKTNNFLPGAIADHLTSAGGQLTDSSQMSSLRWLEAGATGSYGAVVEPCNFSGKFPNPAIVIDHYTRGETLIEAYWKSVQMPGQGIFIGEPLAIPFGGVKSRIVPTDSRS